MIRFTLGVLGALVALGPSVMGAAPAEQDADQIRLASMLSRTVLLDLGLQESPRVEDYVCAQSVLSIASELDPTNADLARLLAEAAWSSGDEKSMINATRTIVRNDRNDTVALLRLIGSNINTHQTAEARLAAYARYLGPSGTSIHPSVRSRLALDAALLEREMGNAEGFLGRLALSAKLDPSNKDAASLSAQIYGQQLDDPVALLNLQVRVLMADPLDPHIHRTLAAEFARQGAVVQAERFLNNALRLYILGGQEEPEAMREQRISLAWQNSGPHELVRQLNSSLEDRRVTAAKAIEARQLVNEPTDDIPNPDEIRLSLNVDRIRLLAAYVIDDEETVTATLRDINRSTGEVQREAIESSQKRSSNQEALFREYVGALLTLEAMRAMVGRESERMREDEKILSEDMEEFATLFEGIEPWILYSEGKYQETIDAIDPGTIAVNNMMILALAYGHIGEIDESAQWYSKVARGFPLSAFGAFARSQLIKMDRSEMVVSAAGHRMVAIERTIAPWIDEMIVNPTSALYLGVEPVKARFGPLENASVRITLRNLSPVPMAVGASRPIESRFLLVPSVSSGAHAFRGTPKPRVLELNRRLSLKPGEEISVTVEADDVYTDWLIDAQPFDTLRGRWRVLQGFTTGRFGGLTNSAFGLVTETPITQRLTLEQSHQTNEEIMALLSSQSREARWTGVRACAAVLATDIEKYRRSLRDTEDLVRALGETYERASNKERAAMLLVLPHERQVSSMQPFDELVRERVVVDGLVDQGYVESELMCAILLTRVNDPLNPVFETAKAHDDHRVRALGELLETRLRDGRRSFSTSRGVFEELAGGNSYSGNGR